MRGICFLCFILSGFSFAQIFSGNVKSENQLPIANANVYIDGSQNVTKTNDLGNFKLDLKGQKSGNIIFQKEGFAQKIISIHSLKSMEMNVILEKVQDIEEVVIIPYTDEAYRNFILYFLDTFIGHDKANVKIKNQKTLKFSYDKKSKFLRVKAPKTLVIENRNLGYILHYNLMDFVADFKHKTVSYYGTSFYETTSNQPNIRLNRMNAYLGSLQHFFRSVYENKVEQEGFWLNYIVEIPNPNYPTEEELQKVKDFWTFNNNNFSVTIPKEISNISTRARESQYIFALTKSKIPREEYVKNFEDKTIFTAKDILQVNFKKIPYQLQKNKIVKTNVENIKTSNVYIHGNEFQVFKTGDITTPERLMTDGDFSENRIENLLPSDYVFGQ